MFFLLQFENLNSVKLVPAYKTWFPINYCLFLKTSLDEIRFLSKRKILFLIH